MVDFNSYIAEYCKRTPGAKEGDVAEKLKNLSGEFRNSGNRDAARTSIWDPDVNEVLSYDDFEEMMRKSTAADALTDDDIELLFGVLNKDGSDDGISYDELSVFFSGQSKTAGDVTSTKIAFTLGTANAVEAAEKNDKNVVVSADDIEDADTKAALEAIYGKDSDEMKKLEALDEDDDPVPLERQELDATKMNSIAEQIANGTMQIGPFEALLTEESYAALQTAVEELKNADSKVDNGSSGSDGVADSDGASADGGVSNDDAVADDDSASSDADKNDYSNPANAKELIELFNDKGSTPKEVADWLKSNGHITDEEYTQIAQSYLNISEKEEDQIQYFINSKGMSREEAIVAAGIDQSDSSFEVAFGKEETKSGESKLSDKKAKIYADQLYDSMKGLGTDDEQFDSIMFSDKLTDADFVKIMKSYIDQGRSFVQHVDGDFSGKKQDKIMKEMAERLIREAEAGNEDALAILCKEFKNGTAGMNGTADEFIAEIFNNSSDKLLAQIAENYEGDIIKDIKGDFSGKTEDNYIKKINDALMEN